MPQVVIYMFYGKFVGGEEYDYSTPDLGASHRAILFMRQDTADFRFSAAAEECKRWGFVDISELKAGTLQIESLNTDGGRKFAGHYEEAMEHGCALAWYPST